MALSLRSLTGRMVAGKVVVMIWVSGLHWFVIEKITARLLLLIDAWNLAKVLCRFGA